MRHILATVTSAVVLLAFGGAARAHCEIPCGIYGDKMRFELIREHITTVEKSMKSIESLGKQSKPDWNQLVRWIDNKEAHADKIQDLVTQYFLTQRITTPASTKGEDRQRYVRHLELLHDLLVTAMKMKQTTDLEQVKKSRQLVDQFEQSYFSH